MEIRCTLTDSLDDIVGKMSDGNPGAVVVISKIMMEGPAIDPDCAFPLLHVLALDEMGIYGCDIWLLYKDACKEDMTNFLAVLRAKQLGIISDNSIRHALQNYGAGFDLKEVVDRVMNQLPNFGR